MKWHKWYVDEHYLLDALGQLSRRNIQNIYVLPNPRPTVSEFILVYFSEFQ